MTTAVHANQQRGVWWVNGAFVAFTHALSALTPWLYAPRHVHPNTWLLTYACWQLATLGITMGYHRLWSHRAYRASTPLRVVLAWMGTLGFQGSIRWWVMRHRLHHRFTDDLVEDPYSARRGFFHSHMGWIFTKPRYSKMSLIDDRDLRADPVVVFQHRHFVWLALLNGILLPAVIASLWGDFWGGLLYAGYVVRVLIWHVTFAINSFAHILGDQEYSRGNTARGGFLIALVTNGEGWHNFHHEFPSDYRNGHRWYHWDPTKWLIFALERCGLGASRLRRTPAAQIAESRLVTAKMVAERELEEIGAQMLDPTCLPWMTPEEVRAACTQLELEDVRNPSRTLVIIDGYVVDLEWTDANHPMPIWRSHPGGQAILKAYLGRDATHAFHGGLNNHTLSAVQWMRHARVARVQGAGSKDALDEGVYERMYKSVHKSAERRLTTDSGFVSRSNSPEEEKEE